MKRSIKIRGYVAKNGMISLYYSDNTKLKDCSDVSMCADNLPEDQMIRQIEVTAEIDIEAIFKELSIPATSVEGTGKTEPPVH
jgi:hypothetical protein